MRYQVFNTAEDGTPVLTAPWAWLARLLSVAVSARWDRYRLVDSHTGRTLDEWARARWVSVDQLDPVTRAAFEKDYERDRQRSGM